MRDDMRALRKQISANTNGLLLRAAGLSEEEPDSITKAEVQQFLQREREIMAAAEEELVKDDAGLAGIEKNLEAQIKELHEAEAAKRGEGGQENFGLIGNSTGASRVMLDMKAQLEN